MRAGEAISDLLEAGDCERVVAHPTVGAISLNDFIVTRVISVAVHGIDVALTIGAEPFTTAGALDVTCGVLEELLGSRAADVAWTREELALWATGRRPVPPGRAPDDVRDLLPVIS